MGDEVKPPTQPSCIWCLDVEAHSLVCSCKYDCGLPDCPVAVRLPPTRAQLRRPRAQAGQLRPHRPDRRGQHRP
jgi:hypothetical protein